MQQFAADLVQEVRSDEELTRVMDINDAGTLATDHETNEGGREKQRIESLTVLQMATDKNLKMVSS